MDASAEGIPVARMGAVEEYGALATFRCSEQAAHVTGAHPHRRRHDTLGLKEYPQRESNSR